ncbi:MAG TPA: hypothetical protein VM754_10140 [Actinomycetota bacterium]|nr:hypothetical protein [Actinomycetota bacterium]
MLDVSDSRNFSRTPVAGLFPLRHKIPSLGDEAWVLGEPLGPVQAPGPSTVTSNPPGPAPA